MQKVDFAISGGFGKKWRKGFFSFRQKSPNSADSAEAGSLVIIADSKKNFNLYRNTVFFGWQFLPKPAISADLAISADSAFSAESANIADSAISAEYAFLSIGSFCPLGKIRICDICRFGRK